MSSSLVVDANNDPLAPPDSDSSSSSISSESEVETTPSKGDKTNTNEDAFNKDGEPQNKPKKVRRKSSSSSSGSSSSEGADDIPDDDDDELDDEEGKTPLHLKKQATSQDSEDILSEKAVEAKAHESSDSEESSSIRIDQGNKAREELKSEDEDRDDIIKTEQIDQKKQFSVELEEIKEKEATIKETEMPETKADDELLKSGQGPSIEPSQTDPEPRPEPSLIDQEQSPETSKTEQEPVGETMKAETSEDESSAVLVKSSKEIATSSDDEEEDSSEVAGGGKAPDSDEEDSSTSTESEKEVDESHDTLDKEEDDIQPDSLEPALVEVAEEKTSEISDRVKNLNEEEKEKKSLVEEEEIHEFQFDGSDVAKIGILQDISELFIFDEKSSQEQQLSKEVAEENLVQPQNGTKTEIHEEPLVLKAEPAQIISSSESENEEEEEEIEKPKPDASFVSSEEEEDEKLPKPEDPSIRPLSSSSSSSSSSSLSKVEQSKEDSQRKLSESSSESEPVEPQIADENEATEQADEVKSETIIKIRKASTSSSSSSSSAAEKNENEQKPSSPEEEKVVQVQEPPKEEEKVETTQAKPIEEQVKPPVKEEEPMQKLAGMVVEAPEPKKDPENVEPPKRQEPVKPSPPPAATKLEQNGQAMKAPEPLKAATSMFSSLFGSKKETPPPQPKPAVSKPPAQAAPPKPVPPKPAAPTTTSLPQHTQENRSVPPKPAPPPQATVSPKPASVPPQPQPVPPKPAPPPQARVSPKPASVPPQPQPVPRKPSPPVAPNAPSSSSPKVSSTIGIAQQPRISQQGTNRGPEGQTEPRPHISSSSTQRGGQTSQTSNFMSAPSNTSSGHRSPENLRRFTPSPTRQDKENLTRMYTEAVTSHNRDNQKTPTSPVFEKKNLVRDIRERYKQTVAIAASPPVSPRVGRKPTKLAKDITEIYTASGAKNGSREPSGDRLNPKKHNLSTAVDRAAIQSAYDDVRADNSDTEWAVFKFDGNSLGVTAKGIGFDKFQSYFGNQDRGFGYIRIATGDDLSKRAKFVLVTWVGPAVSIMKKAKMSTDKALIKDIIQNFSVELQLESEEEFSFDFFKQEVDKAAGARYGTGVRDL